MEFKSQSVPVLPTRNVVIFPGMTIPLNVGRARSVAAIEQALAGDHMIVTVAQKTDRADDDPSPQDLYKVGVVCKIEKARGSREHGYQLLVRGVGRVAIASYQAGEEHMLAVIDDLPDVLDTDEKTQGALTANLKAIAREILDLIPADTRQVGELVSGIDDCGLLTNLCAEYLDAPIAEKQEILEQTSLKTRALRLLELMQTQKETLKVQGEIRDKLSQKIGRNQREAILREQIRTIKEELGDEDGGKGEGDYTEKIAAANMPEDVKKIALDEVKRLSSLGSGSPETHVIRNYLDLLCAMPWDKSTDDALNLDQARAKLDADHYGLEKVKKRIIQHLAVMKLRKSHKGSILLLVGPPGVGKTSLGHSIADALGRKFARVALGGVRDDAEIRGHRRTYIGAMPGRVVQAIKRAGVNNPVMLLDEIDKLGRSFAGDPAGALLEVLDPEQNVTFNDHYLDVAFDLSKTFFICTANSLDGIPGPLLDRMEIIELSGYTMAEKLHIAKNHLIPKQLAEHGIETKELQFADDAVMRMINSYTREAGVRDLERKVSEVIRAETEKILKAKEENGAAVLVDRAEIEEVLGPDRYIHEVAQRFPTPGVVTGLAWTPQGGEILFIESSSMPGSGKLTLTGQLGDVMKESAQIALSLVRSYLPSFKPGYEFDKRDLHIHVPSGAIPKDGPSAGVTMTTALASLFTGRGVPPNVAMTGEITLRGAVTPVGGIKEKVIAAHRAGIERIILPERNRKDIRDVPEDVRAQIKFDFVETVGELLKLALDLDLPTLTPVTIERGTPTSTRI